MSFQEEIDQYKKRFKDKVPEAVQEVMAAEASKLKDKDLRSSALKKGDQLPEFSLPNHLGTVVESGSLLADSRLVICFYRGGWCPYCNLELRAYQAHLDEIKAFGAELVAITPEQPDSSLETINNNKIDFHVLTDEACEYADRLGIVHSLTEALKPIYKNTFNIDMEKHNGEGQYKLPLPATFVVSKNGDIVYSFVESDYRNRLDPKEVVDILKTL
ncbi:peroxiredoxin-like family protein [Ketobacter nezhaii]|uniref:peroxiredoxin-like family protein n=1 Tax=Ketobacter sp. MCCC 1A13808 TaxID=2602738 RepID=UPI0018DB682D|nr:peroxiredoxin-like family protein [Ketobacter sp. MCCC 1A13808]